MIFGLLYPIHEKATISGYDVDPATRWGICWCMTPVYRQNSLSKCAMLSIQDGPAKKIPAPVQRNFGFD
jgi:hypothetical protein